MSIAMPAVEEAPFAAAPVPPGVPAGHARLRHEQLTCVERNFALATHLSLFATPILFPAGCVAPIILWLIRREKSSFNDDHGRELCNVVISGAILTLALGFIPFLGWAALLGWYLCTGISVIRGAVAANRGEYFRYPMTWRFLT